MDTPFVGYVIMMGVIYGGGASLVFSVGWIARQYIGRVRGHSMIVSQVAVASFGGCLLLRGPQCPLHCCASRLGDRTPGSVLVRHPRSHRFDRSRCGARHHLERSPRGPLELAWIRAVPALPGGIGCSAGLLGHGPFVWTSGSGSSNACSLEHFQMEPTSGALVNLKPSAPATP